jgi:hypothetical protein
MASTRHIKFKMLAQQTTCSLSLLQVEEEPPPPPPPPQGAAMAVTANASTERMAVYFIYELIKVIGKMSVC